MADFEQAEHYALGRQNLGEITFWISDYRKVKEINLSDNEVKTLDHQDNVTANYRLTEPDYIYLLSEEIYSKYPDLFQLYTKVVKDNTR